SAGVGNHSRGQAALPTAVRSYLNENRYRFEETRPGVITVWPKFRQS
ncbi:smr protein/MutS2 C-terminal, partial [Trifolium medium]|nr:smr protein/MutS2 C-terminal [Trifolium medium]